MLKAIITTNEGPMLIAGLSEANLDMLRQGKPIDMRIGSILDESGMPQEERDALVERMRELGPENMRLVLFGGKDEQSMARDIQTAFAEKRAQQ
jgi:hypothetical protein